MDSAVETRKKYYMYNHSNYFLVKDNMDKGINPLLCIWVIILHSIKNLTGFRVVYVYYNVSDPSPAVEEIGRGLTC